MIIKHRPSLSSADCSLQLSQRNDELAADKKSMQGQLERFAAAVGRAESDSSSLQQAAEAAAAEQQRLQERCQAAEDEAQRLARKAEALQAAQAALEAQLEASRVERVQAAALQQDLDARVASLAAERDSLAGHAEQWASERAALQEQWGAERGELEAAVEQLRGQLLASNEVLESCRRMLGETCLARSAWGPARGSKAPDLVRMSNQPAPACLLQSGRCKQSFAWLPSPLACLAELPPGLAAATLAADLCRTSVDQQAASLTELLRSVKAELLLKDASVKALTRENAQRAERLQALQAQVSALSRCGGSGLPACSQQEAHSGGAGLSSQLGSTPGTLPVRGLDVTSRIGASGTACSGADFAYSCPPEPQQLSFTPAASGSAAPSYMSLSAQLAWQRSQSSASPRDGSLHGSGAASGVWQATPGHASSTTSNANSSQLVAADEGAGMLQQLLAPLRGAGAVLPPEVCDQQLSYLLELVVAKRLTAAQAQQVNSGPGPLAALDRQEWTRLPPGSRCNAIVLPMNKLAWLPPPHCTGAERRGGGRCPAAAAHAGSGAAPCSLRSGRGQLGSGSEACWPPAEPSNGG